MVERLVILAVAAVLALALVLAVRRWNAARVQQLVGMPAAALIDEAADGRGTVITFSTPSCAACHRAQAPAVKAVVEQLGVNVISVDASRQPELATKFGIMTVPSTVVVAPAGHVVAINQGFTPTKKLVEQLQSA